MKEPVFGVTMLVTLFLPFAPQGFVDTRKALFKLDATSYSGHITLNTNWGRGMDEMEGNVTMDGSIAWASNCRATTLSEHGSIGY